MNAARTLVLNPACILGGVLRRAIYVSDCVNSCSLGYGNL